MAKHHPDSEAGINLPAIALTETTGFARRLAGSLTGILTLFLLSLTLTPWQQNITGVGRVVAFAPLERQQTLQAPVEGRVVQWWVREGSVVKAGDRIADISDNDPQLVRRLETELQTQQGRIQTIESRIAATEGQLAMSEQSQTMALQAADSRIRMAEERERAARHAVTAAEAALKTSMLNFDRQQALQNKGLASGRQYELATLEKAQRQTELDRARATLAAANSEVEAIRSDRRKARADTESSVQKSRADLAKSREELAYATAEKLKVETRLARQNGKG